MKDFKPSTEIKNHVKYWWKMKHNEIEMIFEIPWRIYKKRLK
jgi:hypothetical protein